MVVVKDKEVLFASAVDELDVDTYLSEFSSYYFASVCYKFQTGMV